jgi:hypothetical protein
MIDVPNFGIEGFGDSCVGDIDLNFNFFGDMMLMGYHEGKGALA